MRAIRPRVFASGEIFRLARAWAFAGLLLASGASAESAAPEVGELVRLTRGETLVHAGKKLAQVSKGQEFTLTKREPGIAYVGYLKEDETWVDGAVPLDAIEAAPVAGWSELMRGFQAFRDGNYPETRTRFAKAAQDKEQQVLVNALATRVNAAINASAHAANGHPAGRQASVQALEVLRDTASQLAGAGRISLATALDEGTERLAGVILTGVLPASKVDRADLKRRAAIAERSFALARQAIGARRLFEAKRVIAEGLEAEGGHPGLKAFQITAKRGLQDAEELYETANKMRRFEKGAVHALSAIDDGLKICVDHPRLRTLRVEMSAQFEERTSPSVTEVFLSRAKVAIAKQALEEGRRLYTNRCAECHELEMLDSRSIGGWEKAVAGMSRRANLSGQEKSQIMDYLTAALKVVEASEQ